MKDFFITTDKILIKKEKEKARELKKSRWWKNQLQAGKCYYCAKKFSQKDLTMEHKVPLVRGGKSIKNNLAPVCKKCNFQKKHQTLVEIRLKNIKEKTKNKQEKR